MPINRKGFPELRRIGRLETFCKKLSEYAGKEISDEEAPNAWRGFITDIPQYKLDYILDLSKR